MKYILGFLAVFALVVILIIMLVSGGHKTKAPALALKTLVSYSDSNAVVRLTVDGPVNSQQEHMQDQITVSKDAVTYKRMSGYTGQVTETRQYDNNSTAYATFLQSLSHTGFTKGDKSPANQDERGFCPLGNRYIYELIDGGKTVERYWSTSCGKPKTYLGNSSLTNELFKDQVPDHDKSGSNFEFSNSF